MSESFTHRSDRKYMAATVAAITMTIVIIIGSKMQSRSFGYRDLRAI